jgi:hypothetical protein
VWCSKARTYASPRILLGNLAWAIHADDHAQPRWPQAITHPPSQPALVSTITSQRSFDNVTSPFTPKKIREVLAPLLRTYHLQSTSGVPGSSHHSHHRHLSSPGKRSSSRRSLGRAPCFTHTTMCSETRDVAFTSNPSTQHAASLLGLASPVPVADAWIGCWPASFRLCIPLAHTMQLMAAWRSCCVRCPVCQLALHVCCVEVRLAEKKMCDSWGARPCIPAHEPPCDRRFCSLQSRARHFWRALELAHAFLPAFYPLGGTSRTTHFPPRILPVTVLCHED